jgi:hypothetical protein
MPAFTFEKISPEKISPEKVSPQGRRGPVAAIEKKPRGVISQVLNRLAEARAKRTLRADKAIIARREQTPRD